MTAERQQAFVFVPKRSCTTCAARGKEAIAHYVASGSGPRPMEWFECGAHRSSDNEAGIERSRLEPIENWLRRNGLW